MKQTIQVGTKSYTVPQHWFWKQFSNSWEPQTLRFFEKYIIEGTDYLDVGAWIGPTAMIATSLGAKKSVIIEPNPTAQVVLQEIKEDNNLDSWELHSCCISNKKGKEIIGPFESIQSVSSATNTRGGSGVEVDSTRLHGFSSSGEYSVIKIDIEGAEIHITPELEWLGKNKKSAIWLSLHPPFIDKTANWFNPFAEVIFEHFHVLEANTLQPLKHGVDTLVDMVWSEEKTPEWGTEWGNFFEIGLLPKKFFNASGDPK